MEKRLDWVDQAKGLSIFLVVYGHNFPHFEPYIYSFHIALFFFISGVFHPVKVNISVIKRRAKMIIVPYFIWAFILYFFWLFIGRNYGKSSLLDLSPSDNFLGVFYAQGGQSYMDWGIPMWFLPCIFLVFLFFSAIKKIRNKNISNMVLTVCVIGGFIWPRTTGIHLPWSIDVALVTLGFYAFGHTIKNWLVNLSKKTTILWGMFFLLVHLATFYFNPLKIDMYRSIYGNELLFFISGLTGSIAYLFLFRLIPVFKFFSYIGKHTIVILATHIRALTLIKLALLITAGIAVYEFNETEKLLLTILQILMVIPVIWLVNKYTPLLDGKVKKP